MIGCICHNVIMLQIQENLVCETNSIVFFPALTLAYYFHLLSNLFTFYLCSGISFILSKFSFFF